MNTGLTRLYEPHAYGAAPLAQALWSETELPRDRRAEGEIKTGIAVIGGGYTGLTAALHLAEAGEDVVLLEAERVGWGASGRSGGFCCLGGGKIGNATLTRRFGPDGRRAYRDAEKAAVALVADRISAQGWDVQRHSAGETMLAHTPRHWRALQAAVPKVIEDYGVTPELLPADALRQAGMNGPFHGAMTLAIGFALNPRRYVLGLAQAARAAGAAIFGDSPVTAISRTGHGFVLTTPQARIHAARLIVATNGYSSEDVPDWLRGRTLPLQSSVLATRPLTADEQAAQGWTTGQMCYDTRHLLHYFRLMPDGRFLFGMRGGVYADARSNARLKARILGRFAEMFPAWRDVEIPYHWSGLVCLARNATPFVGPIPEMPGAFAGLAFHGNGVAMGSYAGALLADLVRDRPPQRIYPAAFAAEPPRFPFGRHRRALMLGVNAVLSLADR